MNSKQIGSVRRAISRAKGTGDRIRYSKFVKETVKSWIAAGVSVSDVSSTVGIGVATLHVWSTEPENKFRQVQVTSETVDAADARVSARLANGVRLSTPSIEILIATLELLK